MISNNGLYHLSLSGVSLDFHPNFGSWQYPEYCVLCQKDVTGTPFFALVLNEESHSGWGTRTHALVMHLSCLKEFVYTAVNRLEAETPHG